MAPSLNATCCELARVLRSVVSQDGTPCRAHENFRQSRSHEYHESNSQTQDRTEWLFQGKTTQNSSSDSRQGERNDEKVVRVTPRQCNTEDTVLEAVDKSRE